MQWFKHLLGNKEGDSQFISELVWQYGGDGYYVFYRTLEIMCLEFDIESPAENKFIFDVFFSKFQKISRKKLKNIHETCSEKYQESNGKRGISFKVNGNSVFLKCCKLKTLADRYTQKELKNVHTKYAQDVHTQHTQSGDIDIDIDLDKDTTRLSREKCSTRKSKLFPKEDYDKVIDSYKILKGVELRGNEYKPIQQAIKSMFISERRPEQIIACMHFLEKSKDDWTNNWTINTVRIKLPEFLAGKFNVKPKGLDLSRHFPKKSLDGRN